MKLFGFNIVRDDPQIDKAPLPSFVPKDVDESFSTVESSASGAYGIYVDLDGNAKTETELIIKYRNMALMAECDMAVEQIVNEAIVYDEEQKIVEIVLDDIPFTDNIKNLIQNEFTNILQILDFNKTAYDYFRRWYVDGRIYFHAVINELDPTQGIQELRYIDPTKLRKLREKIKQPYQSPGLTSQGYEDQTYKEYYVYVDQGFNVANGTKGVKIAKDSIVYTVSGIKDVTGNLVLGYLHKAIKPLNQLRYMEDATIIYRISRAPERRVYYIDVGNMPKVKAEQYVADIMKKQKNRLVYDQTTGEIRDDRKFMTMLEDYYLPRRGEGKGTEIQTLPGGQNLGQMADVEYFQEKLYEALNVPKSRLLPDSPFNLGRATEITRDEVSFFKFIQKLRMGFSKLFTMILEKQLLLKQVMTPEEWEQIKNQIRYKYNSDNHFEELKEMDILMQRIQVLQATDPYVGIYFSSDFVKRVILCQTDEDMEQMAAEIAANKDIPASLKLAMLQSQFETSMEPKQ